MSPPSDWVVTRRYGYGAGRIPVTPPTWSCPAAPRPLREGIAEASRERRAAGEPSLVGRAVRGSGPFAAVFALTLFVALFVIEGPDDPDLRIVPFEPEQAPVVVARATEPEPLVEVEAPPKPEPPPPAALEPEPPPPPQVPEPKPEPPPRATPRPQIDHVAVAPEPPPPPPTERRRAERKPPPMPALRPELAIDEVATGDPLERAPTRTQRAAPRFAAAQATRPRPSVTPLSPGPEIAAAEPTTRSERRARPRDRSASRPAPRLAMAAPATPAAPSENPPAPRRTRTAPRSTPPKRRSRAVAPIAAASTGAAAPDPSPRSPTRSSTTARPAAPQRGGGRRSGGRDIPGVPLGSLAACVSDRKEIELVKRVVATARDRQLCESRVGRYHFVETRNVNAFLMRIERAGRGRAGDRCTELTHALDCLSKQSPARSRR